MNERGRLKDELRYLFDEAPIGVVVSDLKGNVLRANRAFAVFVGRSVDEVIQMRTDQLCFAEDAADAQAGRETLVEGLANAFNMEQRFVRPDGAIVTGYLTLRMARLELGDPVFVAHVHDVTARKRAETTLLEERLRDRLTGLANRALLVDRIDRASRRASGLALAVVGLDRFRIFNETHGHGVGDRVILDAARRLEVAFRGAECVARLGGDEFAVLAEVDDAAALGEAVRAATTPRVEISGTEEALTASVGLRKIEPADRADEVLRDAQLALYRAKEVARGQVVTFEAALRGRAFRRVELERALRRAVEGGEIEVFFQPIHRAQDRALAGFEALARWRHPTLGHVSPAEFIPIAEEDGLILPIGAHVLVAAIEQLHLWREAGKVIPEATVAVNVSSMQIRSAQHVQQLRNFLETIEHPECVKLEITESVLLERSDEVRRAVDGLKASGARLVLDDFGTGWSSLTSLHDLPFDGMKIDRSFVSRITTDTRSRNLVRAMVGLARDLGIDCVAEGVETEEQLTMLASMGCEHIQGYFFSQPKPASALLL
ncbi:MAG: EAL domain-containing protein [Myxococcales bacterium]|nr:EAL domain-containing protein [Myxococcales bacterium]